MISKTIVTFIDILGFKALVENHINNVAVIQAIERVFRNSVELIDRIPGTQIEGKEFQDYRNKIMAAIKVKFISDTVLFTLSLSDISPNELSNDKDNLLIHLHMYFTCIAMFCPFFIGLSGIILRGGIAIGSHYENKLNENIFIFSKSYISAYELQLKETARIIVHSELISYLESIQFEYFDKFFYKDDDQSICFDFYSFLKHDEKSYKVLSNIKNGLIANIRKNRNDSDAVVKLKYFVGFHNNRIGKDKLNYEDLAINLHNCLNG